MKLAKTIEDQRLWMSQWQMASTALEEFRRFDLQTMTEAETWQQIEAGLSLAGHYSRSSDSAGLVEQQAWFGRLHQHE